MELKFKPGDKVWAFYHLDGFIEHSEIDCVKITSEGTYYVLGTTGQCVPAEFLFPTREEAEEAQNELQLEEMISKRNLIESRIEELRKKIQSKQDRNKLDDKIKSKMESTI